MNTKVYALPYNKFNEMCRERGITDDNVEQDWAKQAFIQVHGEVAMEEFHFKREHPNVTTSIFDDVLEDYEYDLIGGGTATAKVITDEQAKKLAQFVYNNLDKPFLLHCHAGVSRSGAIAQFICEKKDISLEEYYLMNPYTHPNQVILTKLRKAWEDIVQQGATP